MANFSPWRYQTWVGFPSLHKSDAHYELFAARIVVLQFAALPVAGGPSLIFIRTPQHKGLPHPVLSRSTPEFPALLTTGSGQPSKRRDRVWLWQQLAGLPRSDQSIASMNTFKNILCAAVLLPMLLLTASAQLALTVSPPKIIGQKALVKLAMSNGLPEKIESARAICFLLDDHGSMVGQSSKWVIAQNKTELAPGKTNTFNFVITSQLPFASTNLTAKISFSQVVLDGGKPVDIRSSVIVTGPGR